MKGRIIIGVVLVLLVSTAAMVARADSVVEIRLFGRYYVEPATVFITVAVEPNDDNRVLRVEADSFEMFRASDVTLSGRNDKRLHTLQFKNLRAGTYTLRAQVRSNESLLGSATQELVVTGLGER